jgi:hypothetical protein
LSPERDDVLAQRCAQCERPKVLRLTLSELQRTFCSKLCRRAYHNLLRKEKRAAECKKVCEVCGEEFTAVRETKRPALTPADRKPTVGGRRRYHKIGR